MLIFKHFVSTGFGLKKMSRHFYDEKGHNNGINILFGRQERNSKCLKE